MGSGDIHTRILLVTNIGRPRRVQLPSFMYHCRAESCNSTANRKLPRAKTTVGSNYCGNEAGDDCNNTVNFMICLADLIAGPAMQAAWGLVGRMRGRDEGGL